MSDVPTPTTTPPAPAPGTGKKGRFTGEDLAKIVKPSDDLTKLGGVPLNDVDLEALLADRISGKIDNRGVILNIIQGDDWERARDLAEAIVDALPPELHTDEVGKALDFRPYLLALDGKKITFRSDVAGPFPNIVKTKTVSVKKFMERAETIATEDALVTGANTGMPVSREFDPAQAGVTPGAAAAPMFDPVTGMVTFPSLTDAAAPGQAGFPESDIRFLAEAGLYDIELAAEREVKEQANAPGSYFPVDLGIPSTEGTGKATGMQNQKISAVDALRYPLTNMNQKQVHSLQLKLASAGYFDKLDNGGAYFDGVADENTLSAWKLLLTDSIRQNRSTPAILGEGSRTYRQQAREARLKQLGEIDGSYTRAIANDFGQSVLGRNLQGDEIEELTVYLKSLRSKRAGFVAGDSGPGNAAGPLRGDYGFTGDDVAIHLGEQEDIVKDRKDRVARERAYLLQKAVPG